MIIMMATPKLLTANASLALQRVEAHREGVKGERARATLSDLTISIA